MSRARFRVAALAVALGCAGPRASGPGGAGGRAIDLLVVQNDAAAARTRADRAIASSPGDAWARLAAALAARRTLDLPGEARQLAAIPAAAPRHPLVPIALRRLSELAEESPDLAKAVEGALAPVTASGKLTGLAAYRARVARITAAEVLGDHARAAALRRENGAVSAWTLAGPFGQYRNLDLDRPFPPEQGTLPETVAAPLGAPERRTRALPAPDGSVALDGEPRDGDVFYFATDVTLARGGKYLVALGTGLSAKLFVDGGLVHERRAWTAWLPSLVHLPLDLAPGRHRLLVKVTRTGPATGLHVAFAREDGAPSDATFAAAATGPAPAPSAPAPGRALPAFAPRELARALAAEAGPALAALLAGRDAAGLDREAAKALLAEAALALPGSAAVRAARADVLGDDPTLDPQAAHARAEAALREALARDPGHAEARVALAALLLQGQRLDDADEVLAGLGDAASRPAALAVRARAADARGLAERAEALVAEAIAGGGGCAVLDHGRELAGRRHAVALEGARARALAECRGGRERLADHLRRHGDPAGAADVLRPLVAARPWAVGPTAALSDALVAAGEPAKAAEALEALRAIWPRSARTEKALADARELAGDPAAARAARERALRLDGSDLALRRALALEDGREVLDDLAEDAGAAIRAYEAARRTDDTSATLVLDAAAVEIHPGGTATERTHQVIHVLDPQGVERHGEVSIPAGADVLALRTHKRDGRTLEPERAGGGDKRSVSLAGLEPGDYVEVEYVRSVRGDGVRFAADPFFFKAEGERLFRSTYVVVAPEGLGMEVDAHGMAAPEKVREGGREIVRGLALDVAAQVPEPSSPPTTEFMPFLHVGVGGGRDALQRSLADHVADRARPTEEIRALVREIRAAVGPGAAPLALVRAAVARVSKTILGQGGALGEEASVVLSRGQGSRLVVLKALLPELGARVRVVFARPYGADAGTWRFPPSSLYGQPLLRVEAGGETAWLDPSLRVAPFGAIPGPVLDAEALLLPEPGEEPEVIRTPARAAVEERREVVVKVALDADGGATVEGEDRYFGAAGAAAKGAIERLDADDRRQVIESMLARSFRGVALSEASFLGEEDPEAPLVIRWRGKVPRLARPSNGNLVVDAPILPARLGPRFVQVASRTTPLVLQLDERSVQRVELVAPDGFAPVAAPASPVETPFGSFSRVDRVEGRTLVREEKLHLARGRVPPGRYAEFAAFAGAVDAAQEQAIAIDRSKAP